MHVLSPKFLTGFSNYSVCYAQCTDSTVYCIVQYSILYSAVQQSTVSVFSRIIIIIGGEQLSICAVQSLMNASQTNFRVTIL